MPPRKSASSSASVAKNPSVITRLFRGQVLSSDFFARHWLPVLVVTLVFMVHITTKYTCQTNMERIAALQTQLDIVNNEKARERSLFRGRIRETSMQHIVDSLRLGLKVQPQPPYRIGK